METGDGDPPDDAGDAEEYWEEEEEKEAYEENEPEMAPFEPPAAPTRDDAPRRGRSRASRCPLRSRGMTTDQSEMDMFVQALRAVQHAHGTRGREGDAIKVADFPTVTGLAHWKWNFVRPESCGAAK